MVNKFLGKHYKMHVPFKKENQNTLKSKMYGEFRLQNCIMNKSSLCALFKIG